MNKRNYNGWILCPSKSFPGKFYYFNVVNGETAWSLNEAEKNPVPNNNIVQKFANTWHSYPEPDSPPLGNSPTEGPWFKYQTPSMQQNGSPMFGQSAFPKYVPNIESLPNAWAPMKLPQMFAANSSNTRNFSNWNVPSKQFVRYENSPKKKQENIYMNMPKKRDIFFEPKLNEVPNSNSKWGFNVENQPNSQIFETRQPNIFEAPTGRIFGQTKLFQHPSKIVSESKSPKVLKDSIFSRIRSRSENESNELFRSRPVDHITQDMANSSISPRKRAHFGNQDQQNIFGTKITSKNYMNVTNFNSGRFSSESQQRRITSKSVENLTTLDDFEIASLTLRNKAQFPVFQSHQPSKSTEASIANKGFSSSTRKRCLSLTNESIITDKAGNEDNDDLNQNDLRYLLLAKRKKTDDPGVRQQSGIIIKTHYDKNDTEDESPKKKRVTFNLGFKDEEDYNEEQVQEEHEEEHEMTAPVELDILAIRDLAHSTGCDWYIIVDTETLLKEYDFIEQFVRTDEKCKLIVPQAIKSQVEAICVGDCRGRQTVLVARQLARKLASPPEYLTVLRQDDETNDTTIGDIILNSCIQLNDKNVYVVLITNDEDLYAKAKANDIYCFQVQEIKDGASLEKPEVSFALEKVEESRSDQKKLLNPFSLRHDDKISVNCYRKRLFDDGSNVDNPFLSRNAHASERFKKDKVSTTNITLSCQIMAGENLNDGPEVASQISRDIRNLNIQEGSDSQRRTEKALLLAQKEFLKVEKEYNDFFNKHKAMKHSAIGDLEILNRTKAQSHSANSENEIRDSNLDQLDKDSIPQNIEGPSNEENQATTESHTAKRKNIKSVNAYNINQHLKRFCAKNNDVAQRIFTKNEELMCCFKQIMEEALCHMLQDDISNANSSPPWDLNEALEAVKNMYGDHRAIIIIIEKMQETMSKWSYTREGPKNKRKPISIPPNDLMKILGCGVLLVKSLLALIPSSEDLSDADKALRVLIQEIEDPADPEPFVAHPPLLRIGGVAPVIIRKSFVKKPSEIIDYLKRHFVEWQFYDASNKLQEKQLSTRKKLKISRSRNRSSKILDMINTMSNPHTIEIGQSNENTTKRAEDPKTSKDGKAPKRMDNKTPQFRQIDVEKREAINKDMILMVDKMTSGKVHPIDVKCIINKYTGKKPVQRKIKSQKQNGENSIENDTFTSFDKLQNDRARDKINMAKDACNLVDAEDNIEVGGDVINNDDGLDLEALDYTEMDKSQLEDNNSLNTSGMSIVDVSEPEINGTTVYDNEHSEEKDNYVNSAQRNDNTQENDCIQNNDELAQTNDDLPQTNDKPAQDNDKVIQNNDDGVFSNDSGFECENFHAYSLVKAFFKKFFESFKLVYNFIAASIDELREELQEDRKMRLHEQARRTHVMLASVIANLQSVVMRESKEGKTLRSLLDEIRFTTEDLRIARQVVSKCLHQARMLLRALGALAQAIAQDAAALDSSGGSYIDVCQ